ncbi:TonB family protein [Mucilaginibacter sp. BJC16-A38]|uniref:energy transducer TonB n=1 Tax=Mucilaginibacter phenanthrenivorans TaxID=1234842 RepID=UPI002157B1D9|nr:energy transducer TonB [Mucilaginibacter phenanthrenivorans]MCR8556318.1 TonB family protein [Mucilaginibacter phenanthrenivorans]
MIKNILSFTLSIFLYVTVYAQTGGIVYYLTNSGKLVSSKEKSDYSMVVLPPDTNVDKTMYVVYEYDKSGKVRLITNSKTNDVNLLYQGRFVAYYPNGKKMQTGIFIDGKHTGHEIYYYPNGKLYTIKDYSPGGKVLFRDCRDSTGNILAENGNGKWVQFDDNFTMVIAEGKIENGLQEGEWHIASTKYGKSTSMYLKGNPFDKDTYKMLLADYAFKNVDVLPEFPGGMEAFAKFLAQTIRYPRDAREQGEQGKVIVNFVVEADGSLTNFKITKSVSKSIDDEALRVIKLSPIWNPALAGGKPVRVAYSVPIVFSVG